MTRIDLVAGAAQVAIHPRHGGRIGQISVDGRRLLRGPEDGAELGWVYWGSYPLLPWSNRIPAGRFRFEGREMAVPVNWIDGTALHGLAADSAWTTETADPISAELTIDIDAGPFQVRGRQIFRLAETHLDQTLTVENRARHRVPVGLGIHPWFRVERIRVPADLTWPGASALPTGPPHEVTADEDLREARLAPEMDRCYTGLTGATADVGDVQLSWTGPITQVVVYTGAPGWVCIEPVTMANDGFRLADEGVAGHGVIALDPGQSASVTYRFAWAVTSA